MSNEKEMKGVFRTPIRKYVFCLFFIVTGSIIAVKFGIWGIDEIRIGAIASAVFNFGFAILGLFFYTFAIYLFKHNKGAYLIVDDQMINARYGLGDELHEPVSMIRKVTLMRSGTGIELYLADRICRIINLNNAKEICSYILSVNSGARSIMSVDEAESNLFKHKKAFVKHLVLTIVFGAMMFAHIAWCVILTEGKDLGDFSESDTMVFVRFAVAELITLVIAFFFADKCGKQKKICELSKATLLSAAATEHRDDSLDRYPNVIRKKFFDNNTYRIVIYAPESDVFAYMLERFDLSAKGWVPCYDTPRRFNYLSELHDSIEELFDGVILED